MSARGRAFLEDAEGCKLLGYLDSHNIPTIGVGHTGLVRGAAIIAGVTRITFAECDSLLATDMATAEHAVHLAHIARIASGKGAAAPHQLDALIAFTFNAGEGALDTSTLKKDFIAGLDREVAHALFMWTKSGSDPTVLCSRRAREAFMYDRGFYLDNSWKPLPEPKAA
jgi:lysozyme